jgi:DNA adenine methylase
MPRRGRQWLARLRSGAPSPKNCSEMSASPRSVANVLTPARGLVLSPLRYPGGKSWLIPVTRTWLSLRPRRVLIEPFAGGGSVSLAAVSEGLARHVVLAERDDAVAAIWKVALSEDAHRLISQVRRFCLTETSVRAALEAAPASELDLAFQALLRNRVARGGLMAPQAGLLRLGENGRGLLSRWYPETLARRLEAVAALRRQVTFIHGDGAAVLDDYGDRSDCDWFLDPPYSLAAGKAAGRRLYRHHEVDHVNLLTAAAQVTGDFLATYDANREVEVLASELELDARPLAMRTAHHQQRMEWLVGRDLRWLGGIRPARSGPRHRVSFECRDVATATSAADEKMFLRMRPTKRETGLLSAADAAEVLGVSRRTVDRLMASGELERVRGADGRSYVLQRSVNVVARARATTIKRRLRAPDAVALMDSIEHLVEALREERAALIEAMTERERARVELAAVRAELETLRQLVGGRAAVS